MPRSSAQNSHHVTVDPPIESAQKIFVSPDNKFIYILEPQAQRLIIYDKTGQFILQYASSALTDTKDFTVDEANKVIYFLNDTRVLKIEATHLDE